jgi:hypothetical protein
VGIRATALLGSPLAFFALGCAEAAREDGGAAAAATQGRLIEEARLVVDELGRRVHELGLRYADAAGSRADEWDSAQRSIMDVRQQVEADLAQATASGSEATKGVRIDIVEGLQAFTERVDRARLAAVRGGQEFVAASEAELAEIDGRIESLHLQAAQLGEQARGASGSEIAALRAQAKEIAESLAALSSATEHEIGEAREELAHSIASLSGSVQRQRLEIVSAGA